MDQKPEPRKNLRKLVTLTPELSDRVDAYRQAIGSPSESETLKRLIEDGLKMRDTVEDLFDRCRNATSNGMLIGDIINQIVTDHPLVDRTIIQSDSVIIILKDTGQFSERLVYFRKINTWQRDAYDPSDKVWYERSQHPALKDEIPF